MHLGHRSSIVTDVLEHVAAKNQVESGVIDRKVGQIGHDRRPAPRVDVDALVASSGDCSEPVDEDWLWR
jgi:hypothetical protein